MGQTVIIFILIGFQVVTFLYFRYMIRRELSRENRIDSVRREIEQLIIELDRTADRNIEIVEDRISSLKRSVREGERILKLIEMEREKSVLPDSLYNHLDRHKNLTGPEWEGLSPHIRSEEISRGTEATQESARLSSSMEMIGVESSSPSGLDIEVVDARERAIELHRQGMDAGLISSATGLPRGEVELIISLNGEKRD